MPVRHTHLATDLGQLLVTDHGGGLSGIYFPGHRRGKGPTVAADWIVDDGPFTDLADQLHAFLSGDRREVDVAVDLRGSDGDLAVWQRLRAIPFGATVTYGQLARDLGRPTAARAVAGAVGRNPVSIVVPCHRVIGTDGAITGYAGGVDRKRRLLELEGTVLPTA